jgi:hypothetical protein
MKVSVYDDIFKRKMPLMNIQVAKLTGVYANFRIKDWDFSASDTHFLRVFCQRLEMFWLI